jgi:hypothetical protein
MSYCGHETPKATFTCCIELKAAHGRCVHKRRARIERANVTRGVRLGSEESKLGRDFDFNPFMLVLDI